MKKVTMFEAEDGSRHETAEACEEHDAQLGRHMQAEGYLDWWRDRVVDDGGDEPTPVALARRRTVALDVMEYLYQVLPQPEKVAGETPEAPRAKG